MLRKKSKGKCKREKRKDDKKMEHNYNAQKIREEKYAEENVQKIIFRKKRTEQQKCNDYKYKSIIRKVKNIGNKVRTSK